MHVTRKMIHKDVRLIGIILRPLTNGTTVDKLYKTQEKTEKKVEKYKPKSSQMQKIFLKREDGSDQRMVILSPKRAVKDVPAVLFLHGGGYALGCPEEKIGFMEQIMSYSDCVMFAPVYTLSVYKPYPSALEDAYRALLWMKDHCAEYGCRSDQLFVVGESGGGGLCAALTILARDRKEVNIAFQMPLFPQLDDRLDTDSAKDNDAPMADYCLLETCWKLYLGERYGEENIPAYAAPARLTDFHDLPPAYTYVGTIDPLYDETRIYFEKLKEAGVETKADFYEGGFHGFDALGANKPLGKRCYENLKQAFQYAAEHYFKAQD